MGYVNILDIIAWLVLGFSLVLLAFFARFLRNAKAQQNKALNKVDYSIELQKKTNQNLMLVVNELRRSNQYLADLAGLEPLEEPEIAPSESTEELFESESDEPMSHTKLYVGNIDYSASESELASHFAPFGQVEFVNIPINRYTGKARGFGFVTFATQEEAERAMTLNGSEFKGRQIQVNFAKERERETA